VSPTRDRQRAAARAKLEREMAARAEAAKRRRQLQIGIASGVTVLLLILGTVWLVTRGGGKGTPAAQPSGSTAPLVCQWIPEPDPSASPAPSPDPVHAKDVGLPPTDPAHTGTQTMTMTTNQGVIEITLYTSKAPCAVGSYTHLASKKFFDNTKCHRVTTDGNFVLQCGDPAGDGRGGPSYRFPQENLPQGEIPTYPEGIVAMALPGDPSTGQPVPNSSGSQFFIVYKDSGGLPANYPVIGKVTKGLDVVKKIAEAGAVGTDGKAATDGKPKNDVIVQTVTVSAPQN
jgi:peptidyl-prolyl cis-trans isomerase B (cyclophilin B)